MVDNINSDYEEDLTISAIELSISSTESEQLEESEISENSIEVEVVNDEIIEEIKNEKPENIVITEPPPTTKKIDFTELHLGELIEEAMVLGVELSSKMSRDDIIVRLEIASEES